MDTNAGSPNLYDAIGVSAGASADKIKKKTRQLINDVKNSQQTKEEKDELIRFFKRARETLCDPESRKEYDATIGIETVGASEEFPQESGVVPFESSLGPIGAIRPLGGLGGLSTLGVLSGMGSLMIEPDAVQTRSPASALASLMSPDLNHMFSNSIIPEELAESSSPGGLKRGTFQVLEYTKVRNPEGGYDEFGFTRRGDMKHDRVTEKRFERKS